ncbi:hypothetical protein DPMN_092015 [Dreissena polymorpha]|uniref:Uncharacterized protein n=1 Tax=Dreissena polymorpha TaxID=45954 RepID=A0A9D4L2S4_DREPO|nr:hypothetical protein DPMN_092015 [Dreissena polymorpha]
MFNYNSCALYVYRFLFLPAGADEEHGIVIWREVPSDTDEERDDINMDNRNLTMKTYDLPFVMNLIRNFRW